jgi:hypothetical protein
MKLHAKKKAKKRVKKAALGGLDDHGEKAGRYSSSSSNSNSSSNDSDSNSDSSLSDQSSNYGRRSWLGHDGERDGGGIVTVDE